MTSYVGIAGLGPNAAELPVEDPRAGVFGFDRSTPLIEITDGTATTMAVAETAESNGPWKAGGPATVRGLDPSRRRALSSDSRDSEMREKSSGPSQQRT